jgi:hypothetical protein
VLALLRGTEKEQSIKREEGKNASRQQGKSETKQQNVRTCFTEVANEKILSLIIHFSVVYSSKIIRYVTSYYFHRKPHLNKTLQNKWLYIVLNIQKKTFNIFAVYITWVITVLFGPISRWPII